jgi:hypothetical protein
MNTRIEGEMSKVSFSSPQIKRITTTIPIFIYGRMEDGNSFQELTRTLAVDIRGGLIELDSPLENGLKILAVNENTGEDIQCCVVSSKLSDNGRAEVGITFDMPSPNFWGIKFSSKDVNPGQSKYGDARQFIESGAAPVTAEMYRSLMGRIH